MQTKKLISAALLVGSFLASHPALAGLLPISASVEPYVSISGVKTRHPSPTDSTQSVEVNRQWTTYGLRANFSLLSSFTLQAGMGLNKQDVTQKTSAAVDTYGKMDYSKDMNMSTADQNAEVRTVSDEKRIQMAVMLDPSFAIFLARAKLGVEAVQRSVALTQNGTTTTKTPPILYNPLASVSAGIKINPLMYFVAEYGFVFYNFPKTSPFAQQLTVSFGVGI